MAPGMCRTDGPDHMVAKRKHALCRICSVLRPATGKRREKVRDILRACLTNRIPAVILTIERYKMFLLRSGKTARNQMILNEKPTEKPCQIHIVR